MIFSEEQQRRLGELGAASEDLQAGFADVPSSALSHGSSRSSTNASTPCAKAHAGR